MLPNLHWLFINMAVVVAGTSTPITRYATFKNLDMTSYCHVGVMVMDKGGRAWVIQSNGNGTNSITWDEYARKWGTHKINISEWIDSVDGTILEGAVVVGNLNYDVLLDKCSEVRDAMIGYLSGKNGSLSILTTQTCPPNKRYCGHDPEVQAIVKLEHSQRQELLISCGDDGRIPRVDICDDNCTSNRDKAVEARCQCSPNTLYCGHELGALDGWMDFDIHNLYLCLDGISVNITENCSNGCVAMEDDSVCSAHCLPNNSYCGHELLETGMKGYDPNTVYHCQPNGQSAISITNCSEKCEKDDYEEEAFCQCHPGRLYCAHELIPHLNWWWIKTDDYTTDTHRLGQCLPGKQRLAWSFNCIKCIASQGEKDAYCQWTPGLFCGRDLKDMGWPGYDADTLYQCGEEEKNINVTSICPNGTCRGSTCKGICTPNRSYCGWNLLKIGLNGYDSKAVHRCDSSGQSAISIANCSEGCVEEGDEVACQCHPGRTYCVHELVTQMNWWVGVTEDFNRTRPHQALKCLPQKNSGKWSFNCATCIGSHGEKDAYCQWTPGPFCGRRLIQMGFTGYENDTLYHCGEEPGNASVISMCLNNTCQENRCYCIPTRTYCGQQQYWMGYSNIGSEEQMAQLNQCNIGGTTIAISKCKRCISSGGNAKCACIGTELFFGHELYADPPYDNNNIYRCNNDGRAVLIQACSRSCTRVSGVDGIAAVVPVCTGECIPGENYCGSKLLTLGLTGYNNSSIYSCSKDGRNVIPIGRVDPLCTKCTPGRSYCGHQLSHRQHLSQDNLQALFKCQSDGKLDFFQCTKCANTGTDRNPVCRQQCIHNSRYCGSDLLGLEGWDNEGIHSDVLYQCTNEFFVSQELNCTQGCQGKNGDVDAYCLGMPIAWYWILLATGLPLLFISLCIGFIRTIIKHRRLQKFVSQHRINANQLTLVRKLGHGQFGEVHLAKYTDPTGQQMDVAVKISKHHLNTNPGQNLASANCFFQESVALDFLQHQNITRALGICSNLKMAGGITTPALVLEYMDGGNSADYIIKEREHLQSSDLMRIIIDICQAGEHLQKMGVIHRDIGARNVLIRKLPRNGKPAVAKLTDFGLAKDVGKSAGVYKSTIADRAMFHEGYTAPEGFRGEFSSQSDVWSFGVFMWELYMLMDRNQTEPVTPYSDIASQDILREIGNRYRLKRPFKAPDDIYSIMTECWTWMPESRPMFRQLRKTLQAKRNSNGAELALELVSREGSHVAAVGEQREEETTFSEQSPQNSGGYTRPS